MKTYTNKYNTDTIKYGYLRKYEILLNQSYDYENEGILNKIMSNKIFIRAKKANNNFLLTFLALIDTYLIELLLSIKELKNFKNYLSKNF